MTIDRQRLMFAANGFLAEMRKRFVAKYPDRECPIRALEDYDPADQSALMAGIQKAIDFTQPAADGIFQTWCERRAKNPVDA